MNINNNMIISLKLANSILMVDIFDLRRRGYIQLATDNTTKEGFPKYQHYTTQHTDIQSS